MVFPFPFGRVLVLVLSTDWAPRRRMMHFCALKSVPLLRGPPFAPVPHCLNSCGFSKFWNLVLWGLQICSFFGQICFGYSRSFVFHINFSLLVSFYKNACGNFGKDSFQFKDQLLKSANLLMLDLSVHEHGISLHLSRSPLILLCGVLWFLMYMSCVLFVKSTLYILHFLMLLWTEFSLFHCQVFLC